MSLQRDGEKRNKTKVSSVALVELVDSVEFTVGEECHEGEGEEEGEANICFNLPEIKRKTAWRKNVAKNKDGYEMHRRLPRSPQSDTLHGKARVIASSRILKEVKGGSRRGRLCGRLRENNGRELCDMHGASVLTQFNMTRRR